jgi:tartrate dehydrogenase/decarboxylase / D-malate dehydrogenase
MRIVHLAVIPGDGIGPEVVREGIKVLDAAAEVDGGLRFEYTFLPWSCQYYLEHGQMMPPDGLKVLSEHEHIFLGAVGWPSVPDHVSLWGLLLPIRRGFQQYVNLRPVRLLRGITSPLRAYSAGQIDFVVLRENTEGEYSNIGGRLHTGQPYEVVIQNSVFTRIGTERIMEYAFALARRSRKNLVGATKSNGINYTMPFWDEIFRQTAQRYPDVTARLMHADALAAQFVLRPDMFDVVVASNLLGDLLTDLGGAIQGGIGMAPSANLNPNGEVPCMFEPVHGSAPDIAGQGIANPVGQIWSAKLLLDHLGKSELGGLVLDAVEDTLESGDVTPDLGGRAGTGEVGDAVVKRLRRPDLIRTRSNC